MGIEKEIHVSTLTNAVICSQTQYAYPPVVVFVSLPTQVKDEATGKPKTVGEVHTYACLTHLSDDLKRKVRDELSDAREKIAMAERAEQQRGAKAAIEVQEMPFDKIPGWDAMTPEQQEEAKVKAKEDPDFGKSKIVLKSN